MSATRDDRVRTEADVPRAVDTRGGLQHYYEIRRREAIKAAICSTWLIIAAPTTLFAQAEQPSPSLLTLDEAMQYAVEHYPTVRAALEDVTASAAGVSVARSAYLPRLDALWQSNRATANNVFGQVLPQSVIPAMSGPVLSTASSQSVWGAAAGALFSWEPFDFGLRRASVAVAESALARARAHESLTRLQVQEAVAAAFLDVLAAERAMIAARADVERRDVLRRAVQALVDNELRPGAEASRTAAERAAAETRLIQSQRSLSLSQIALTRLLGGAADAVSASGETLLAHVPADNAAALSASGHPLAAVHQAAVDEARAAEDALSRTDRPRVSVLSSVFARGSGANPSGVFDGGVDGLGFDRANWAAGVQITFPNLFDLPSMHARRAAAGAAARAETARYDEAILTVTSEQRAAAALLRAARDIAANTPIQLAAAQQSERQARARYDAGLATVIEVAEAQNLLAQAEVQDQLARVDVWRALLAAAAARGDLAPFIDLVRHP